MLAFRQAKARLAAEAQLVSGDCLGLLQHIEALEELQILLIHTIMAACTYIKTYDTL